MELKGITNQLKSNGTVDKEGYGGSKHTYSRCSLMTFAFLEIFSQARMQINSEDYRKFHGDANTPRRIKRVVVTCPTTMSECERKSLVRCAKDAVTLLTNFEKKSMTDLLPSKKFDIEIVPSYPMMEVEFGIMMKPPVHKWFICMEKSLINSKDD